MTENVRSWSTTAATNANADGGINWAENQLPGSVNNSARSMMAALVKFIKDNDGSLTSAGTANAQTLTANTAYVSLETGLTICFKAGFTNTGAATFNLTPLGGGAFGAKAIKVLTAGGEVDLVPGQIAVSGRYTLWYNTAAASGVGAWILINPVGSDVVVSARNFGCVGDNSTSNNTAFAAIRTAALAGLISGVRFPKGIFRGTTWDLSDLTNFTVEGEGGMDLTHAGLGTVLCFIGLTGPFIDVTSSSGWAFRNLAIVYTQATFTGNLVDISWSPDAVWTKGLFDRIHFYQFGASTYTARLIYAHKAIDVSYTNCRFSHADVGIIGATTTELSTASAAHTFIGCDFVYITTPILNPGLTWAFHGCRFEPNSTNAPAGILVSGGDGVTSNIAENVTLHGCSFSDCRADGTWVDVPNWFGGGFFGCSFSGDIDVPSTNTVNGIRATNFFGIAIVGCLFSGCSNGIVATTSGNGVILGNSFPNTTTPIANPSNWAGLNLIYGNNLSSQVAWAPGLPSFTVAGAPSPVSFGAGLIFLSNEAGGATVAFSDGAAWRRVQDRAIIS